MAAKCTVEEVERPLCIYPQLERVDVRRSAQHALVVWSADTGQGKYSKMITLGQQLNLPKLQCYLDYMGAFDDLDQLGIATSEVMPLLNVADDETEVNPHFGKVKYHTLTAKSDWQFAPSWNFS